MFLHAQSLEASSAKRRWKKDVVHEVAVKTHQSVSAKNTAHRPSGQSVKVTTNYFTLCVCMYVCTYTRMCLCNVCAQCMSCVCRCSCVGVWAHECHGMSMEIREHLFMSVLTSQSTLTHTSLADPQASRNSPLSTSHVTIATLRLQTHVTKPGFTCVGGSEWNPHPCTQVLPYVPSPSPTLYFNPRKSYSLNTSISSKQWNLSCYSQDRQAFRRLLSAMVLTGFPRGKYIMNS